MRLHSDQRYIRFTCLNEVFGCTWQTSAATSGAMSMRRRRQPSPFSGRSEGGIYDRAKKREKWKGAAGSASRNSQIFGRCKKASRVRWRCSWTDTFFFRHSTQKKHIANDHHRPTMENIKQCQQIGSSNSKKNIEEPGSQPEACGKKIKETENLAEGGAGKTPGGNWKQFKTVRMRAKGRGVVRN